MTVEGALRLALTTIAMATTLALCLLPIAVAANAAHPAPRHPPAARLLVCPPPLAAAQMLSVAMAAGGSVHGSVHAAQAAARALLVAGHAGDIVVELCPGTHPLHEALVIGLLDVAAGNHTVEYRGPRGGSATLDAGLPVTGWAPSEIDGVWKASSPPSLCRVTSPSNCGPWPV